jgi:hypothetical protein
VRAVEGVPSAVSIAAGNAEQQFALFNDHLTGYSFPPNAQSDVRQMGATSRRLTLIFQQLQQGKASLSSLGSEIITGEVQLRSEALAVVADLSRRP